MKKISVLLVFISLLFSACDTNIMGGIKGEGAVQKEERSVSGFKGIDLMASGNVFVKKGNAYKVVVETHSNIANELETIVKDGILLIRFKDNVNNISYDKLNIYVEAPQLESLDLTGSGNIEAENGLTEGSLNLGLSGSGNILVKSGVYSKLTADVSGSGGIDVKGTSESANMSVSGSGNIDAYDLKAKMVEATITGSGNIDCHAETELNAMIVGSGDISYKGSPSVRSRVTGSGDVEKH